MCCTWLPWTCCGAGPACARSAHKAPFARAHRRAAAPAGMCCAARCGSAALPRLAAVRVLGAAPAAGLAARLETLDLARARGGAGGARAGGRAAAAVLAGRALTPAQARRAAAGRSAWSGAETRCPCCRLGAACCARALRAGLRRGLPRHALAARPRLLRSAHALRHAPGAGRGDRGR